MSAAIQLFRRLLCRVRGHRYRTPYFTANTLYFCDCCGEEMFGRTFADLTPMTDDEREEWDSLDDLAAC